MLGEARCRLCFGIMTLLSSPITMCSRYFSAIMQLHCSSRRHTSFSQLSVTAVPPVHSCTEGVKPGPIDKMVISKPTPNRMAEGVRSTRYKGMVGLLADLSVLKVEETDRDFHIGQTTGDHNRHDCRQASSGICFRKGSVLTYQQPKLTTKHIKLHQDAPSNPSLPLVDYQLGLTQCVFVSHGMATFWEDVLVQRLHPDPEVTGVIREKTDSCYFNMYMHKYLSVKPQY
ncbi:unnamed protein product, partial [Coregonus sp. 'balchen']